MHFLPKSAENHLIPDILLIHPDIPARPGNTASGLQAPWKGVHPSSGPAPLRQSPCRFYPPTAHIRLCRAQWKILLPAGQSSFSSAGRSGNRAGCQRIARW